MTFIEDNNKENRIAEYSRTFATYKKFYDEIKEEIGYDSWRDDKRGAEERSLGRLQDIFGASFSTEIFLNYNESIEGVEERVCEVLENLHLYSKLLVEYPEFKRKEVSNQKGAFRILYDSLQKSKPDGQREYILESQRRLRRLDMLRAIKESSLEESLSEEDDAVLV